MSVPVAIPPPKLHSIVVTSLGILAACFQLITSLLQLKPHPDQVVYILSLNTYLK
jgi:hypothetical protein